MNPRFWMALATLGPVGNIRPAPGSWGSAAAVLIAAGLASMSGWFLEAALVAACVAGVRAADVYELTTGQKDASPVVIDEVAGQWLTLAFVPPDILLYAIGFIAFRIFDIYKPWPIRTLEQNVPGALGVMVDDVAAAVYAAVVLYLLTLFLGG